MKKVANLPDTSTLLCRQTSKYALNLSLLCILLQNRKKNAALRWSLDFRAFSFLIPFGDDWPQVQLSIQGKSP